MGLNPSIRIYRYSKGQYFDCHCELPNEPVAQFKRPNPLCYLDDESNVLTLNTKPDPTPAKTTWTLLLYLTSPSTGCQGGETVFYPDDLPGKANLLHKEIVISLETGMVLLHKHGNDCMLVSILWSVIYMTVPN